MVHRQMQTNIYTHKKKNKVSAKWKLSPKDSTGIHRLFIQVKEAIQLSLLRGRKATEWKQRIQTHEWRLEDQKGKENISIQS